MYLCVGLRRMHTACYLARPILERNINILIDSTIGRFDSHFTFNYLSTMTIISTLISMASISIELRGEQTNGSYEKLCNWVGGCLTTWSVIGLNSWVHAVDHRQSETLISDQFFIATLRLHIIMLMHKTGIGKWLIIISRIRGLGAPISVFYFIRQQQDACTNDDLRHHYFCVGIIASDTMGENARAAVVADEINQKNSSASFPPSTIPAIPFGAG